MENYLLPNSTVYFY